MLAIERGFLIFVSLQSSGRIASIFHTLFVATFLLVNANEGHSQDTPDLKSEVGVTLNAMFGQTLDIHPFFPETTTASVIELAYFNHTRGKRQWHGEYNFPDIGWSAGFVNLGNADTLGQALAIQPVIMKRKMLSERLSLRTRYGLGVGYVPKAFDVFESPGNYVIGSRITAVVSLMVGLDYQLSDHLNLQTRAGMWHFSNGHVRVPNIGANIALFSLGMHYTPTCKPAPAPFTSSWAKDSTWYLGFELGLGRQEIEGTILPFDGPTYSVYYGNLSLQRRTSYKSKWALGLELNYFTAYRDLIINWELFDDKESQRSYKVVMYGSHEFYFDWVGIESRLGVNLYFPIRDRLIDLGIMERKFMHRYLSHQLLFKFYPLRAYTDYRRKVYFALGLKTLGGKADYAFAGLGFTLGTRK